MVEKIEINITWIEKIKQISCIFTNAGGSPNVTSGVLRFNYELAQ